jgi:hypothetical protein
VKPQLGEVWEINGALLLIVQTDSVRDGWYDAPIVGLILHDDDDMWEVGETLNFGHEELAEDLTNPRRPTTRIA